ncbi:MAG: hypothetical protein L6R37_001740 [Teloschistes peruensis]|nr:MAG: hypothetical protein L6R37_001740 [Teloschistes peruensis]
MALVKSFGLTDSPRLCVSRQISACSICRGKKIKCDGLVPVCTPCQKARRDAECTNGSDKLAKGKERSYVTALEARLVWLEKDIARVEGLGAAQNAQYQPAQDGDYKDPTTRIAKGQRKEESHVNDLVSDFGFLSVNATSRDFDGLAQDVFAQLILTPSTLLDLPHSTINVLPSRPSVTALVQQYIDQHLALYPFISEVRIFGSIEALYEGHASPSDEWIVFLVLAIALASSSTSSTGSNYSEAVRYAGAALKYAKVALLPGSLQSIQLILLLVQYSIQDPHHFDSWYLVGAAARMMVDLGLHQDPPESVKMKDAQLNLRRRIFHSVYSMDRLTSLTHRRTFSFTDDSANVLMPKLSSPMFADPPTSGHPALELIRLRQAVSPACQSLFQSGPDSVHDPWPSICAAYHAIDDWHSHLQETSIQNSFKLCFQPEVLYTKILLLSPSRLQKPLEDYGQLLILEHSIAYSQIMSTFIKDHTNRSLWTSYDLSRTVFVAQRTLEIFENFPKVCFSNPSPQPPQQSPKTEHRIPPLAVRNGRERLYSGIETLRLLDGIVRVLARKYGVPSLWRELKLRFERMETTLRARAATV